MHFVINLNFLTVFLFSTPPRAEMVVSPRKRFLREMENSKTPVEDINCQKRSRSKVQTVPQPPTAPTKGTSPISVNGNATVATDDAKPARNCSYSITSLLADDRNVKQRSPTNSPSHFTPVTQPYATNTSEERWYSESVDRLRSIELSVRCLHCEIGIECEFWGG